MAELSGGFEPLGLTQLLETTALLAVQRGDPEHAADLIRQLSVNDARDLADICVELMELCDARVQQGGP